MTIIAGAFALVRQSMRQPGADKLISAPECIARVIDFMDRADRELEQYNRLLHSQTRTTDNLRQEISQLRTEISEIKGMLQWRS